MTPGASRPSSCASLEDGEVCRAWAASRAVRSTCASSPPPTATCSGGRCAGASSARTSTSASTWSRSRCRRCASAARTSRCWPSTSSPSCASERKRPARHAQHRRAGDAHRARLAGQRPRAAQPGRKNGCPFQQRHGPEGRDRVLPGRQPLPGTGHGRTPANRPWARCARTRKRKPSRPS